MIFFETIAFRNGVFENLAFHNIRLNATRKAIFGCENTLALEDYLFIPEDISLEIVYRCRVEYDADIEKINFYPYHKKEINTLQIVDGNGLVYHHKFNDRSGLNELVKSADADDVLIVRGGLLTDTSYSNVALFDGSGWYTPTLPLLAGTRRAALLEAGVILPREIPVTQLSKYSHIRIFNAMLPWNEAPTLPISCVFL